MESFHSVFRAYNWEEIKHSIYQKSSRDVERALLSDKITLEDFKALLSPAADAYLEVLAQRSHLLTQKRFGKTIQLFAPLYLSNECQNICTYCGFSMDNKIKRKTLTLPEINQEVAFLQEQGFRHVLLVTGESNHHVHLDYFLKTIGEINSKFNSISIEFQPLETFEYAELKKAGVHAVLLYQETYHEDVYKIYHPKGKKSNFQYRLESPDRIGLAGIHKIGLGVLLGLEDWRVDSFFCGLHLKHLQKKYWKTKYSVSFPRMRPAEGIIDPNVIVSDRNLVQLIGAYRLLDPDLEISISTRESPNFRNNIIPIGVTSMSAGSKTNPGGYSVDKESLEQFETDDQRSADDIVEMIRGHHYEAIWKDWDKAFFV